MNWNDPAWTSATEVPPWHGDLAEPMVRADLPYQVRMVDNLWIPLSDGTRLAARAWLPVIPNGSVVPAILEAIPYRKSDITVVDNSVRHGYFAGHGYASIRLDLRGSGDSAGFCWTNTIPRSRPTSARSSRGLRRRSGAAVR